MLLCGMKAYHKFLTGVALLSVIPLIAQEEVLPTELPAAVRSAVDRVAEGEPIKKVTRLTENGRSVYLVEVDRNNAINPRWKVSESGELLLSPTVTGMTDPAAPALDPSVPAPVTYNNSLTRLEDAPQAVQETVRNEARGREIADIDREVWEGRTVYEIEFRADGPNPQLHVAEDGTVVRGEETRRGMGQAIRSMFLGTQLSDTPPAVQETIQREAAGRAINDIDVERRTGNVIYEVEIRDPQSGIFQLHVNQDGRVTKDSRVDASQPNP